MAAQPDADPDGVHAAAAAEDAGLSSTTPDDDHDNESRPSVDDFEQASPSQLPPKRKGGRKPVYATVEERKQRNRQAQAAFRERRTEYIKQLEFTLKQNQQLLQTAQNDQHAVAHECSALRYKIATLEKIMSEKGIDVEAEVRAKGEYPSPAKVKPDLLPLPSGNRSEFQSRRGFRGLAPKLDLRGKMIQLQPSAAQSHFDLHTSRTHPQSPLQVEAHAQGQCHVAPWQPPSPADHIQSSPSVSHFRGEPSPNYGLQNHGFSNHKDYGNPSVEYDGRQTGFGVLPSPSFHNSVSGDCDPATRTHIQHQGYNNVPGFDLPGNMNGLGKVGQFDFYSAQ